MQKSTALALCLFLTACSPETNNKENPPNETDAGFISPGDCDQIFQIDNDGSPTTSPSGTINCDGQIKRNQDVTCSFHPFETACSSEDGICQSNSDCQNSESCLLGTSGECACVKTCSSNEDCSAGESCSCGSATQAGETVNRQTTCVPSNCSTDSECSSNLSCGVSVDSCGNVDGFFCHTASDTCTTNSDCGNGKICRSEGTIWSCQDITTCG